MRRLAPLLVTLACSPTPATTTEDAATTTGGATTGGAPTTGGFDDPPQPLMCVERNQVDVLFVLEDGPAAAASQDAMRIAALVLGDVVAEARDYDLRVAFTGASVPGPQCDGADGDDGALQILPCRARPGDFVDPAAAATCESTCPHDQLEILPTTIAGSPAAAPRPWLESITEVTNTTVPLREALACVAPAGDAGCRFPAPLAAMRRALDRTRDPADPAFGFLRPAAHLVVVFVAVSPDCSASPGAAAIFAPDSPFLSDPMTPTPGLCWNAGVACTGDAPTFTTCDPAHFALDGTPGATPDAAVLVPVDDYKNYLQALVDDGLVASARVQALAGVPTGYPGQPILYSQACDPAELAAAAICPGCTGMDQSPAPPVRLRALAEAFRGGADDPRLTSLCGDPSELWIDYVGLDKLQLHCVDDCPVGECRVVTETLPGGDPMVLPACEGTLDTELVPPPGSESCFALITGDLLSPECEDDGHTGEVFHVRSSFAPHGTCTATECTPCAP